MAAPRLAIRVRHLRVVGLGCRELTYGGPVVLVVKMAQLAAVVLTAAHRVAAIVLCRRRWRGRCSWLFWCRRRRPRRVKPVPLQVWL